MLKSLLPFIFSLAIILIFAGCSQPAKKEVDPAVFHAMLERYWSGLLKLQPLDASQFGDSSMNDQFKNTCTQAYRDEVKQFYTGYSDSLQRFSVEGMKEEDVLSYNVLKYDAAIQLEKLKYDTWKIPFTQMGDATNTLSGNIVLAMGQYGSGESSQPFKTVKDYGNWLKRVSAYTVWCDSAIQNFRQGMATGYVLPKTLVVKMIDICNGLGNADVTKSICYGPVKHLPAGFSAADKDSITKV